jgi:anti-sigma regulatory factor (Ser/Thr protein kinase)
MPPGSARRSSRVPSTHAGLPVERCADLVLAVSEVAANTLSHTRGGGTVHVWASGHDIICQVNDGGWISDPMAGGSGEPPRKSSARFDDADLR